MAVVRYGSSDGPELVYDYDTGQQYWSDGQNVSRTGNYSSDPYGGTPIQINTGASAQGLQSIGLALGEGFQGLQDLIMQTTDKNNAWSAAQAQKQMDFQERMNQIAMEFNAGEAAKNRDWQEIMSNTAHQREIADLKAAGLNPVLSASGGNGAPVTSGATASGVTSAGAKGDTDTSANSAFVSLYGALINSQTQMYNANLSAQTNLAIADKQAAASAYAAQLAAETARYSNPWQIATQVIDMINGDNQGNRGSGYGNSVDDIARGAKDIYDKVKGFAHVGTNISPKSKTSRSSNYFSGNYSHF